MDQQKIDRLFREKLDHLEVTPSADSWSQVEKSIRPKKTPLVYWIAASVTLFVISWILRPETSQTSSLPMVSDASHPVNQQSPDFILPVIERKEDNKASKTIDKAKTVDSNRTETRIEQQFAVNESKKEETETTEIIVPEHEEMDNGTAVAEIEEPVAPEEAADEATAFAEKPVYSSVKITYIASSKKETKEEIQKNDSTGVLKKFIAFTGKIDPGNMLADMKTAKDNLFNGGLKNKKDRSTP